MAVRPPQHILVFQQGNSGEAKIAGIRRYGGDRFRLECIAIDQPLPAVLDDTGNLLPEVIRADLVLDYLRHPDLSEDLAALCAQASIPMIAPGRQIRYAVTPPT
jgi:thymidylate synthase